MAGHLVYFTFSIAPFKCSFVHILILTLQVLSWNQPLTHWDLVTLHDVRDPSQRWFSNMLAPRCYLCRWWFSLDLNEVLRNFGSKNNIFIQQNALSSKRLSVCSGVNVLTHWGEDEMAAILQTIFSDDFFVTETHWISCQISLDFVPRGTINHKPSFI